MPQVHAGGPQRRLRATLIGLGLDGNDNLNRMITGENYLLIGGSAETHAELVQTALRLDSELERLGRRLGELTPNQLAEVAWRIDSPALWAVALRLETGLERTGRAFHELTPAELTQLTVDTDP
jgi:hypothetical protein